MVRRNISDYHCRHFGNETIAASNSRDNRRHQTLTGSSANTSGVLLEDMALSPKVVPILYSPDEFAGCLSRLSPDFFSRDRLRVMLVGRIEQL